jgi:dihydroxyacetone kinase-like protein
MEKFNICHIKSIFEEIRDEVVKNKDLLVELDAVLGDGDLGITMSDGFTVLVEEAKKLNENDIGTLIMRCSMVMANEAPSTLGTLVATAIMRAGKAVKGCTEIGLKEFVHMSNAAIEAIIQRGRAKKGDKTILDSIIPAGVALEEAYKSEKSVSEAINAAYEAACEGVEATKQMKSVHGRAACYGDKSIGHQDGGATLGMLINKGIKNYIDKK